MNAHDSGEDERPRSAAASGRARSPWLLIAVGLGGAAIAGTAVYVAMRPVTTPAAQSQAPPAATTKAPAADGPFAPDAKVAATELRLRRVIDALDLWLKKHMSYPELAELLVRDDYLRPKDFDDAWGRRIDYTRLDELHYRLCSRGPDNLPKTDDDVCLGGKPGALDGGRP